MGELAAELVRLKVDVIAVVGAVTARAVHTATTTIQLTSANEAAAPALGLRTQRLGVKGPVPDLDEAFAAMVTEHADAVLVLEEPITVVHRKKIAEIANAHRLPSMFARDWTDAGGLMAYGTSLTEATRRMAGFVVKILKGASAGNLPVETVNRPEFIRWPMRPV